MKTQLALAVADPSGVISFADHVPPDHLLIGCGFKRHLRRAVLTSTDRASDGQTPVVPGAANDLGEGIRALQARLGAALRPIPDRWRTMLDVAIVPVELPLWTLLRGAAAPMTIGEMRRIVPARGSTIKCRLDLWRAAGLAVCEIDGRIHRWALAPGDRPARPPRINRAGRVTPREATAIERTWRAMRTLTCHGTFDLPIVMLSANAGERTVANLINVLMRADYLRQVVRGNGALGTFSTYRLIRNTGPRAPSVKHRRQDGRLVKELVDGNTGERVDVSPSRVSLRKNREAPAAADGGGRLTMLGNHNPHNPTNRDKAQAAWAPDAPAWVLLLADACDRASQRVVADTLGKSSGYISRLVNRSYAGSYPEAEQLVRARLGTEEVQCPALGLAPVPMPLRTCIRNRRRATPAANWAQVQFARVCPDCPNNTDRPTENEED